MSDGSHATTRAWGLTPAQLSAWLSGMKLTAPIEATVEQAGERRRLDASGLSYDGRSGELRLLGDGERDAAVRAVRGGWAAGDDRGVLSLHLLAAAPDGRVMVRFTEPAPAPSR